MSIATSIQLKGLVEIDLHKRDGELIETIEVPNKIVDRGLELMSRHLVSAFLNDAVDHFTTLPIQAIAVGTDTTDTGPVSIKMTSLKAEWARQRLEEVDILRASHDVVDNADPTNVVLTLTSRIHGAYGNRIKVEVLAPIAPNNYYIRITDENDPRWDGDAWVAGSDVRESQAETLSDLLLLMAAYPTVEASARNQSWVGIMATNGVGDYLSGGGTGVVVSATFHNSGTDPVILTEAALYTSDTPGEGTMFNMVRFPGISVTSDLDISFRWKLLFQQA